MPLTDVLLFLIPASELKFEAFLVGYEVSCKYRVFGGGFVIVNLEGGGRVVQDVRIMRRFGVFSWRYEVEDLEGEVGR